jgi:hypothetical protein
MPSQEHSHCAALSTFDHECNAALALVAVDVAPIMLMGSSRDKSCDMNDGNSSSGRLE